MGVNMPGGKATYVSNMLSCRQRLCRLCPHAEWQGSCCVKDKHNLLLCCMSVTDNVVVPKLHNTILGIKTELCKSGHCQNHPTAIAANNRTH